MAEDTQNAEVQSAETKVEGMAALGALADE